MKKSESDVYTDLVDCVFDNMEGGCLLTVNRIFEAIRDKEIRRIQINYKD